MNSKKYILKPGKHQFAPGSHPVHDNDNLTDAEAEWYLKAYPHIASLFVERLESCEVETLKDEKPVKQRSRKRAVKVQQEQQ
jgi:hypothetical protein